MSSFYQVAQLQSELNMVSQWLNEARNPSKSEKDRLGALSVAGHIACDALSKLLHAGRFWLGLQRTILNGGLQLSNLDELNRLDPSVAAWLLAGLNQDGSDTEQTDWDNYAEGLRNEVEWRLQEVKEAAAQSYRSGGLHEVNLDETWHVEASYMCVDELRTEICKLVPAAKRRALSKSGRARLWMLIGAAVGVLGWAIEVAANFEQIREAAWRAGQDVGRWIQAHERLGAAFAIVVTVGFVMMTWHGVHALGRINHNPPNGGDHTPPKGGDRPQGPRPRAAGRPPAPGTRPSTVPGSGLSTTGGPRSPTAGVLPQSPASRPARHNPQPGGGGAARPPGLA